MVPWFSNSLYVGKLSVRAVPPIRTPTCDRLVSGHTPPLLNSVLSFLYLLIHRQNVYPSSSTLHFFL